jgi:hypothetical protein
MTVKVSLYPAMPNRISTSFPGTWIDQTYGPPSDTFQVTLREGIEIVDSHVDDDVVFVGHLDRLQELRRNLAHALEDFPHIFVFTGQVCEEGTDAEWHHDSGLTDVTVGSRLSADIATRMVLKVDGRHIDIGTAVAKEREGRLHLAFRDFCLDRRRSSAGERVEVHFVADKDVARRLTDVYEIYEGEIVFTNMLVRWE